MNVPRCARRLAAVLFLQVVRLRKRTSESPVDFLLLVIDLDLAEVEGALLRGPLAASRLVRGDEDVKERVLQEFLLVLASLPAGQNCALDVVALCASEKQHWGSLVDAHGEVEVLHRHFATSAAAASPHGPLVGLAPGPGTELDFFPVSRVLGLSFDACLLYTSPSPR